MFTINKVLIVAAAVIATGLVAAVDIAKSGTETPTATVAARFPSQAEMMVSLGTQTETPAAIQGGECSREHWPYIADECLTTANGGQVKRPARKITTERPVVASVPASAPATQMASR
jgi:hypothetical protein